MFSAVTSALLAQGESLAQLKRGGKERFKAARKRIGKSLLHELADAWGYMIFQEVRHVFNISCSYAEFDGPGSDPTIPCRCRASDQKVRSINVHLSPPFDFSSVCASPGGIWSNLHRGNGGVTVSCEQGLFNADPHP